MSFVQVTALPTNAWANENTQTHWLILSRWHAYPDIDQSHHVAKQGTLSQGPIQIGQLLIS